MTDASRPPTGQDPGTGDLPRVDVLSLGGTIAMTGPADTGVVPTLTGEELVRAVPALAQTARITASSFRLVPGAYLTLDDVIALARELERRADDGADGAVVTQGTDTLEEVAFALDLLVRSDMPVIVTGAMRNPTQPGADGPANLLAAVQVAVSRESRGLGALVVFNDEIHAARYVQKTHPASPAAFRSPLVGPIGWVAENTPRIVTHPLKRQKVRVPEGSADSPVALLTVTLGDDGRLLEAVRSMGYRGLVVEALGVGHVPARLVEPLQQTAAAMPVVFTSRAGAGEVLRRTYGFPGSESDLRGRGLIGGGHLDGPKARILLSLLLRAGASRQEIAAAFEP